MVCLCCIILYKNNIMYYFYWFDAHILSTRFGYGRPDFLARAFAAAICDGDNFWDLPKDFGLG